MAAPNLLGITSVVPHTQSILPADTVRNILVNTPSTGQAHKINTLIVANNDESSSRNCTIELCLADGTTFRPIANNIVIPASGYVTIIDKNSPIYLLDTSVTGETATLYVQSMTASKLIYTCSYETVS